MLSVRSSSLDTSSFWPVYIWCFRLLSLSGCAGLSPLLSYSFWHPILSVFLPFLTSPPFPSPSSLFPFLLIHSLPSNFPSLSSLQSSHHSIQVLPVFGISSEALCFMRTFFKLLPTYHSFALISQYSVVHEMEDEQIHINRLAEKVEIILG